MLIHLSLFYPTISKSNLTSIQNKILNLIFCGADRDRTCDPRVANAMLSQLSYSP